MQYISSGENTVAEVSVAQLHKILDTVTYAGLSILKNYKDQV